MSIYTVLFSIFIANILTVGFHIELGLGLVFFSIRFNGILFYLNPRAYMVEEDRESNIEELD